MKLKLLLASLFLILAGCAGMPNSYDPSKLSADQLSMMRGSTLTCTAFPVTGGMATVVYVNMSADSGNGNAMADSGCKVTANVTGPVAAASAASGATK